MKVYQTSQIRNVAFAGHSGAGKTSLAESLLHLYKMTDRRGTVDAGTTQSDYDPLEKSRKISINATLLPLELENHKVNILDCPGYRDFVGEIKNAIRTAEMCLIVIDAETGVEVGTEFAWEFAREYDIPVAIAINKMDKDRADFNRAMESVNQAFDAQTIPVTLPIGSGSNFRGVIDLLDMKAIFYDNGQRRVEEIPAEMQAEADIARRRLVEAAAEGDDTLTEHFLETETLTEEELRIGLREDLQAGRFVPVVCCSAEKGIGLLGLMHFIMEECPSPDQRSGFHAIQGVKTEDSDVILSKLDPNAPFSAFVFKTVNDDFAGRLSLFKVITGSVSGDCPIVNLRSGAQMKAGHVFALRGKAQVAVDRIMTGDIGSFSKLTDVHTGDTLADPKGNSPRYEPTHMPPPTVHMAVRTKDRTEEEKISISLHRLLEADATLALERDSELHQTILHGMGDTHLDVAVERLRNQSKIDVTLVEPKVQYRETLTRPAQGQGRHKRQSGGRGQYGDCHIKLEPLSRGEGFEYDWKVVGGAIPTNFKGAIEKGLRDSLTRGILAGYPVVDLKATCYDGSYHDVDSSDMAFQIAASLAFKNVAPKAGPVILEPIMRVVVTAPAENMGDVMGYLSQHRGRIIGNEQTGRRVVISAEVPQGEMVHFSRDLRSMTQGRAVFTSAFNHYEPCPPPIQEKVIKESSIHHAEVEA